MNEDYHTHDDIDQFDKKLKVQNGDIGSSSEDEKPMNEFERMKDKNRVLIERLYKKEQECNEYKGVIDLVSSGEKKDVDLKDKKIIELAKKNKALNILVENLRNKASRAMVEINKTKQKEDDIEIDNRTTQSKLNHGSVTHTEMPIIPEESDQTKKKIKDLEQKLIKYKGQFEVQKSENDKITKLLLREVGESLPLDEVLKQASGWKGRAEEIQRLKKKLRETQNQTSTSFKSTPKSISSIKTSEEKQVERNLEKLESDKVKETEKQNTELKFKYKALKSRQTILENDLRETKENMTQKIKLLIDKTENDDKLIAALKDRLKLKDPKTISIPSSAAGSEETYKMKNEIRKLKSDVMVLETEIKNRDKKIKAFEDQRKEEGKEQIHTKSPEESDFGKLQFEVEHLKLENEALRQQAKRKKKDETDNIINDLTKQNLQLRKKVDDLNVKLSEKS